MSAPGAHADGERAFWTVILVGWSGGISQMDIAEGWLYSVLGMICDGGDEGKTGQVDLGGLLVLFGGVKFSKIHTFIGEGILSLNIWPVYPFIP